MARTRVFCEQGLGPEPQGLRLDGKFTCRLGGTALALVPKPEGTKAERTAVSFRVPRIELAVADLKARGVPAVEPRGDFTPPATTMRASSPQGAPL